MPRKDYYVTLGVTRGSTQEEIRKAYRALARRFHPDRNTESPEAVDRFREITEAYDTLGDPEKRRQYDRLGPLYHPQGRAPSAVAPSVWRGLLLLLLGGAGGSAALVRGRLMQRGCGAVQ